MLWKKNFEMELAILPHQQLRQLPVLHFPNFSEVEDFFTGTGNEVIILKSYLLKTREQSCSVQPHYTQQP